MKKIPHLMISVLLAASLVCCTGCGSDWEEEEKTTDTTTKETTDSDSNLSEVYSEAVRDPQVSLLGNGDDTVTILVYMNGSNLESDDGSATADLTEMVKAGSSDKVNIVVQTMGTKSWDSTYGIASDRSQIYTVDGDGLTLVKDDLGQLDSTVEQTLTDFVSWGAANYPASRYELILWDHGGGPVYGFGYDEYQDEEETLTLDEIQSGLKNAGVYFDFIGFDACIMSSLEVGCALFDYCDYMILSEDFEPGSGWCYTDWLKSLYENTSIDTLTLGTQICDAMIEYNESDSDYGESCILSLLDVGKMKVLYKAWEDFAYANEDSLLDTNYSQEVESKGRVLPALARAAHHRIGILYDLLSDSNEDYSLSDYYITDIMALASTMDSDEASALSSALDQTVLYTTSYSEEESLTGISVTLPYGDSDFYDALKTIFTNCGMDSTYVAWLERFTSASGSSDFYDDWSDSWSGWDSYEDDYDWNDWDSETSDSYWSDSDDWGWSDWDYDDSFNEWYDDSEWFYDDEDEEWYYYGDDGQAEDDWFYDDYDDYGPEYYDDYGPEGYDW